MPKFLLVLLLPLTLSLSGCWDAIDIKDLIIPFVGGYDYTSEGGQSKYIFTTNYPIFGQTKEKSDVMVTEGKTFGQTRVDRGNKSPRSFSFGDIKALLIGNELAGQGTKVMFDILFRNPQLSETIMLAVTQGRAEDIINLQPGSYETVGRNVIDLLKNSGRNNFIPDETLHTFRINVLTPGFNPVLPVIKAYDQQKLEIVGAAIFKKYHMVAMLNDQDMRVLTWLRGEKKDGDILFSLTDNQGHIHKITFEGSNDRSVKVKLENGVPTFNIEVKLKGTVVEDTDNFQLAGQEQHVKLVEKALEDKVKTQCMSLVRDLQGKYRVDSILLGEYVRAKWPPLVKQQDWDEVFCNSSIKVKVKAAIQGSGEVA